jgi:glycosyltransferase involved in cell wall biosynthesis
MRVSVIMSVYNAERYVSESILSILSQSYTDFEFIIINDGSTDNSGAIIKHIAQDDKRILYYEQKNMGLIYSLNKAIDLSTGEYLIRMDADDVSSSERIETMIKYMDTHPELVVLGSYANCIDSTGKIIGRIDNLKLENKKIKKWLFFKNQMIHPSVCIRKSLLKNLRYEKIFKDVEDYELWTRLIFVGEFANLPKSLLKYRVHSESVTRKKKWKMRFVGLFVRFLFLQRTVKMLKK